MTIPEVSADDLKAVYNFYGDLSRKHPNAAHSVPPQRLQELCGLNANVHAIARRATLLRLLITYPSFPLFSEYLIDGQPSDKLFYAAARFPLEELPPGEVGNLDMEGFMQLLNES